MVLTPVAGVGKNPSTTALMLAVLGKDDKIVELFFVFLSILSMDYSVSKRTQIDQVVCMDHLVIWSAPKKHLAQIIRN